MLNDLMFSKVNVTRPTASKGSSGGETDTYATVYSALPCNVQPASANWLIRYAQRGIDISHHVFFDSNPTITNGDRIVFGTRIFLVKGIRDLVSLSRVLVVDALELL